VSFGVFAVIKVPWASPAASLTRLQSTHFLLLFSFGGRSRTGGIISIK
jgi:hypothetical protein